MSRRYDAAESEKRCRPKIGLYIEVAGGYLSDATMLSRAANALIPPTIIIP